MVERLQGKVVLITGGRQGLGKAFADALTAAGCVVITTSRETDSLDLSQAGPGTNTLVALDVTDEASVRDLFRAIDRSLGRLDALVNNAGVGVFKPITAITLEEWNRVLHTNLTGAFLCCREAFSLMKAQGGGRILNVGSIADYLPLADNGAYGASKAGLRGLSAILNEEGKADAIRVTHLSPGAALTEIWRGREGFSAGDMLRPEDVAESVLDVISRPLHVRIDEIKILPAKGALR